MASGARTSCRPTGRQKPSGNIMVSLALPWPCNPVDHGPISSPTTSPLRGCCARLGGGYRDLCTPSRFLHPGFFRGSVLCERGTDASGVVLSQTRYTEFDEVRTDVGSISQTDFGYTFQRNIADMGLMDYKARFRDLCAPEQFL